MKLYSLVLRYDSCSYITACSFTDYKHTDKNVIIK